VACEEVELLFPLTVCEKAWERVETLGGEELFSCSQALLGRCRVFRELLIAKSTSSKRTRKQGLTSRPLPKCIEKGLVVSVGLEKIQQKQTWNQDAEQRRNVNSTKNFALLSKSDYQPMTEHVDKQKMGKQL
jgi:hypothetical protein